MLGVSDYDHIVFARKNRRVIFTQDVDFIRLHKTNISHCGIVYAPQQTETGCIVRGLMLIYDIISLSEMQGKLEYL